MYKIYIQILNIFILNIIFLIINAYIKYILVLFKSFFLLVKLMNSLINNMIVRIITNIK